jgi:hypothetical protein
MTRLLLAVAVLLAALAILMPTAAKAQHYHPHYHSPQPHWRYQGDRWYWMVPAIVGGIVVYEATKPAPQPPTIIQTTETCGPWTEVQTPDGKTYRERTCTK